MVEIELQEPKDFLADEFALIQVRSQTAVHILHHGTATVRFFQNVEYRIFYLVILPADQTFQCRCLVVIGAVIDAGIFTSMLVKFHQIAHTKCRSSSICRNRFGVPRTIDESHIVSSINIRNQLTAYGL